MMSKINSPKNAKKWINKALKNKDPVLRTKWLPIVKIFSFVLISSNTELPSFLNTLKALLIVWGFWKMLETSPYLKFECLPNMME